MWRGHSCPRPLTSRRKLALSEAEGNVRATQTAGADEASARVFIREIMFHVEHYHQRAKLPALTSTTPAGQKRACRGPRSQKARR